MKCNTRDFGEVEINEDEIVEFVQPPFGFEKYGRYAFLYDEAIGTDVVWLQSVDDADVCFILFDPSALNSFYKPTLSPKDEAMLGEGELLCWVIGVVPTDFKKATVNLRSPIIVNMQTRRGAQIVLEQDYPFRFPLVKGAE